MEQFVPMHFIVRPARQGEDVSVLLTLNGEDIEMNWTALEALQFARGLLASARSSIAPLTDFGSLDGEELDRPERQIDIAMMLLAAARAQLEASLPARSKPS